MFHARPPMTTLITAIGIILLVVFTILILLWAFTEELPRLENRVPFYERLQEGSWAVEITKVGRRKLKAMRLVNEVIGGDISAATQIVERAPIVLIEGISEADAIEIADLLREAGAEARAYSQ